MKAAGRDGLLQWPARGLLDEDGRVDQAMLFIARVGANIDIDGPGRVGLCDRGLPSVQADAYPQSVVEDDESRAW